MKKKHIQPKVLLFQPTTIESFLQTVSLPKTDDETIDDSDEILVIERNENEFEKSLW